MMIFKSFPSFLLLLTAPALVHGAQSLTSTVLNVKLPKPLSDLTATLVESTGTVYIAGGCDFADGTVFNSTDGQFLCGSISDSLYAFDIATETFTQLTSLPRPRYRHAAAVVENKLWLVGGRDLATGSIIPEVDVYDVTTNEWITTGTLPTEHHVSDHAAFAHSNYVYIVGGYDDEYLAYFTTFRINTSFPFGVAVQPMASLTTARGDIASAAVYDDINNQKKYAYVSGGFSHTNSFCSALDTVERYDVLENVWETLEAKLVTPRADKALVILDDSLFAVGGERQIDNICSIPEGDLPDPGEQTVAVDDVEVLLGLSNDAGDGGTFQVLTSLPEHRFRLAAVAWEPTKTIYSFGGQSAFDASCNCFRTTDEVVAYVEEETISDDDDGSSVSGPSPSGPGLGGTSDSAPSSSSPNPPSGAIKWSGSICVVVALVIAGVGVLV